MTKNVDFSDIHKNLSLDDMPNEIWKDVVGHEGLYVVSNFGRVKSLARMKKSKNGTLTSTVRCRIMSPHYNKNGYVVIQLTSPDGTHKLKKVHRLVCEAFIQNPENKSEVNHIDGVKSNNNVSNLEWTTRVENHSHAINFGLIGSVGQTNHNAQLTNSDVLEIVNLLKKGVGYSKIAEMFSVQPPAIHKIKTGRNWSHLTGIPFKK